VTAAPDGAAIARAAVDGLLETGDIDDAAYDAALTFIESADAVRRASAAYAESAVGIASDAVTSGDADPIGAAIVAVADAIAASTGDVDARDVVFHSVVAGIGVFAASFATDSYPTSDAVAAFDAKCAAASRAAIGALDAPDGWVVGDDGGMYPPPVDGCAHGAHGSWTSGCPVCVTGDDDWAWLGVEAVGPAFAVRLDWASGDDPDGAKYAAEVGMTTTVVTQHGPGGGWPIVEFVGPWAAIVRLLADHHQDERIATLQPLDVVG
jgi:hypothetical protein